MIKELTKSGMVGSFDEAVNTASGLYQNGMPQDRNVSQVLQTHNSQAAIIDSNAEISTSTTEVQTETADTNMNVEITEQLEPVAQVSFTMDHVENKISCCIKDNNVAIANEMKKMYSQMADMKSHYEQEIAQLKNFINTMQVTKQHQDNAAERAQPVTQHQSVAQTAPSTQAAEAKPEAHPRQGEFTPQNVELESYFYYGTK